MNFYFLEVLHQSFLKNHASISTPRYKKYPHQQKTPNSGQALVKANFIDGLIYPSIAGQNSSENIALKKEAIDQGKLVFWNAKAYRVNQIRKGNKWDVGEVDFALADKNGTLKLKGARGACVLNEEGTEAQCKFNGLSWNFFDRNGNYYN